MKQFCCFIYILLFVTPFGCAQDSLRIDRKAVESEHQERSILRNSWEINPALHFEAANFSLSAMQLNGIMKIEDEAISMQEGDGVEEWGIQARSFLRLSDQNRVWGEASYRNGLRRNVRFNETSDYSLLYPYVMADTIGGDMHYETYRFMGGYARRLRKTTLGIELAYRAAMEFRSIDPRPNNTVSDLDFRLGASHLLDSSYRIGLSWGIGKYKQDNNLKFFSTLGSTNVYHLSGLGMDYVRFSGSKTNTFYDGLRWSTAATLYPIQGKGWMAHVGYEYFYFDKLLNDINDMTLNKMKSQRISAEAGYLTGSMTFRMNTLFIGRKGSEMLYGAATGSYYPQIGIAENYSEERLETSVSVLWEERNGSNQWYVLPQLGYINQQMKYQDPYRLWRGCWTKMGITGGWTRLLNSSTLSTEMGMNYGQSLATRIVMNGVVEDNLFNPMTNHAISLLASSQYDAYFKIRWYRAVSKLKGGMFAEFEQKMVNNSVCRFAWHGLFSVGILF